MSGRIVSYRYMTVPTKREWQKLQPRKQVPMIELAGWKLVRITGSHWNFENNKGEPLSFPLHNEVLQDKGISGSLYKIIFKDYLEPSSSVRKEYRTFSTSVASASNSRKSTTGSASSPPTPSSSSSTRSAPALARKPAAPPSLSSSISASISTPIPAAPPSLSSSTSSPISTTIPQAASSLSSSISASISTPIPAAPPSLSSSTSSPISTTTPQAASSLSSSISASISTPIPAAPPSLSSSTSAPISTTIPAAPAFRSLHLPKLLTVEQQALKLYALQHDIGYLMVDGMRLLRDQEYFKGLGRHHKIIKDTAEEEYDDSLKANVALSKQIDLLHSRIRLIESGLSKHCKVGLSQPRAKKGGTSFKQLNEDLIRDENDLKAKLTEQEEERRKRLAIYDTWVAASSAYGSILKKLIAISAKKDVIDDEVIRLRKPLVKMAKKTIFNPEFFDLYNNCSLPGCSAFLDMLYKVQVGEDLYSGGWDEGVTAQTLNPSISISLEWKLISYLMLALDSTRDRPLAAKERLKLEQILREVNEPLFQQKLMTLIANIPELLGIDKKLSTLIHEAFFTDARRTDFYKATLREPPHFVLNAASLMSGDTDEATPESPFGREISSAMMAASLSSSTAPALTTSSPSYAIEKPYVSPR